MTYLDNWLNRLTMYRLTLYWLIGLIVWAALLGEFHYLSYSPISLFFSTIIALGSGLATNYIFARLFKVESSLESVYITALILVLIIAPLYPANALYLALASSIAMASKYLLAIGRRHLFNPAAVGLIVSAWVSANFFAVWWVGTPLILPLVIIGGFLISRRLRRLDLILTFLFVYLGLLSLSFWWHQGSWTGLWPFLDTAILGSAVLFFVSVMLTEPLTSPSDHQHGRWYGALAALLYATPVLRLTPLIVTPEMALAISNVYSFLVNPKYRLNLRLKQRDVLTPDTYAFTFSSPDKLSFRPGQYMEWTLPHQETDRRGIRRHFSLASAPSDPDPMIIVKFHRPSSSYKQQLLKMRPGDEIMAAGLAGDFVLSKPSPSLFIAGGVGAAPFVSMIREAMRKHRPLNAVLIFSNRRPEDIFYRDLFRQAESLGLRTIYCLTDPKSTPTDWTGATGRIDGQMIRTLVPDYRQRHSYISGPPKMIQETTKALRSIGVKEKQIVTDYFFGY